MSLVEGLWALNVESIFYHHCFNFYNVFILQMFGNCSCIGTDGHGWAVEGACAVDCTVNFTIFLVIQCILRFLSSSGRAGNTLIQFRFVLY